MMTPLSHRLPPLPFLPSLPQTYAPWPGRFVLEQQTNAYAVLPDTQWRGYRAPLGAPKNSSPRMRHYCGVEDWGTIPIRPTDPRAEKWRCLAAPPSLGRKRPRSRQRGRSRIAAVHNVAARSFVHK